MSLVLVAVGVAATPAVLVLAAVFGVVTAILWYHASGRLASRVYRRVERQAAVDGGTGAGPTDAWRGPHRRRGRARGPQAEPRGRTRRRRSGASPPRRAYEVLGLEPGADQAAIRRAYRQRIKEVHPDTEGGDEAAFRRVRQAYERLSE